ncbi:MAG: hypothetical protein O7G29_12485 [Acidobacteria bacterium]|nr:hypothetical protein [Acidobacteriota bacterium]
MTFGLGLVSMRERLHSAGGEFLVEYETFAGTLIQARVPFLLQTFQVEAL